MNRARGLSAGAWPDAQAALCVRCRRFRQDGLRCFNPLDPGVSPRSESGAHNLPTGSHGGSFGLQPRRKNTKSELKTTSFSFCFPRRVML